MKLLHSEKELILRWFFVLLTSVVIFYFSAHVSPVNGEPLKRLFTSASDRAALERIKSMAPQERAVQQGDNGPPAFALATASTVNEVIVRGIVRRERAAPVVWVNESNTLSTHDQWQDLSIHFSDTADRKTAPYVFNFSNGKSEVALMPGQVWIREKNVVSEGYLHATFYSPPAGEGSSVGTEVEAAASNFAGGVRSLRENALGPDVEKIVNTLSPDNRINQAENIVRQESVKAQ